MKRRSLLAVAVAAVAFLASAGTALAHKPNCSTAAGAAEVNDAFRTFQAERNLQAVGRFVGCTWAFDLGPNNSYHVYDVLYERSSWRVDIRHKDQCDYGHEVYWTPNHCVEAFFAG